MYEREQGRDTSTLSAGLFRLGLIIAFVIMVGRLFQLQVVQGEKYTTRANDNRLIQVEIPAQRGVIYDKNKNILARNRPSFEIALVPEQLPDDDLDTPEDELGVEITRILTLLLGNTETSRNSAALRIEDLMFRELGRSDYIRMVEAAGAKLDVVWAPGDNAILAPGGSFTIQATQLISLPDTSIPLPLPALTALIKRAVEIGGQGSASRPVPILDQVQRVQAFDVEEEGYRYPSIRVNEAPVRQYVYGSLLSHVLGFMGPIRATDAADYKANGYFNPNEKVGVTGLELQYQAELRGTPRLKNVEVDILGRELRTVGTVADPIPGSNLILNVDKRLQLVMQQALEAKMTEVESLWGVAIAMNPQNGAVLGLVSLPSFDDNIFAERISDDYLKLEKDKRKPLINYAIGGLYPPGSTFKLVTATAALSEGIIDGDTTLTDTGPLYVPNRYFPNDLSQAQKFVSWNHRLGIVHGPMNVVQALALSNDIYFYLIGGGFPKQFEGLNNDRLVKWMELFGYGDPTGIDLPGEVGIAPPSDQWKRKRLAESWTTGDNYNMAIGQGYVLATPLQVLVSTVVIANGGTVYQPQLVYQVTDSAGNVQRDFTPHIVRQLPASEQDIQLVRQGMWTAVNSDFGTAVASRMDGITVAGKTGTAEFCDKEHYNPEKKDCLDEKDLRPSHAWYVAYAPYENPEIAVVVFVHTGGEGSGTALPVAKTILEAYFKEIAPRPVAAIGAPAQP